MSSLSKSIFLAFSKSKLTKEIEVRADFNKAKNLLVRLAERPPYTVFSIFTALVLKKCKRDRRLTVIAPKDSQILFSVFPGLFDEKIEVDDTPTYGSKAYKAFRERLPKQNFDVMLDLDSTPLPELAVTSSAKIRIACSEKDLFPFFNIMFRTKESSDLAQRSLLVVRSLTGEESIERAMPRPQTQQLKAAAWLKDKGNNSKKSPYLLSSLPIPSEYLGQIKVYPPDIWQSEPDDTKAALLASAAAYIGGIDTFFELAYLLNVPSIVPVENEALKFLIPPSHLVRYVPTTARQMPSTELLIKSLADLSL